MNLIIAFFWTEAYYTWGRVLEKLISAQNEILISGWWRSQHVYKVEIMIGKQTQAPWDVAIEKKQPRNPLQSESKCPNIMKKQMYQSFSYVLLSY